MGPKNGIVYLLNDRINDVYKIGVTRGTAEDRIKKLQTGNANEIRLVKVHKTKYPFFIEKKLHLKFAGNNVMNEWYYLTHEDVDNFEEYCGKEENIIEAMKDNPFFTKNLK